MTMTQAPDRLIGVDLRSLSESKMTALRKEAIRRGIGIHELIASLIEQASERLIEPENGNKAA
jgi:predicted DNA binding CopG/RHH family protein